MMIDPKAAQDPEHTRLTQLVGALLRLRGDTLNGLAKATDIQAANLSVWLRGRQQVISSRRLAGLLHHMGVAGGRLRTDMLHVWRDHGALDDTRTVAGLLAHKQPWWLVRDEGTAMTRTRFLLGDGALIRFTLGPDLETSRNLQDVLDVAWVLDVAAPLARVPIASLQEAGAALLGIMEGHVAGIRDKEPVVSLLASMSRAHAIQPGGSEGASQGWGVLHEALLAALDEGAMPEDIAQHIKSHGSSWRPSHV
jgi:hypothetical protein